MNLKLSLLVTAAFIVAVTASSGEAGKKLEAMRNHFLRWKDTNRGQPTNYATSSAYSSAGSTNAASSAGVSNGGRRYGSPYQYVAQDTRPYVTGYEPAVRRNVHGPSVASRASAGYDAASASGYASSAGPAYDFEPYGYEQDLEHAYVRHGSGKPAYGKRHGHGHGGRHAKYAGPEVAYHGNYAPPMYSYVPPVHPPVPQVAESFFGGRGGDAGVSTSVAAAGSVAAAAAAAAASKNGGVTGGVSFGSHGPSGSSAGAAASSHEGGYAAHSYQPVDRNERVVETESSSEHYSKPESLDQFAAATGTHASDGRGVVTSSYVRSTENEEEHEDGKENSDHHYKANSYGKTFDENHQERFNRDDEDVVHTPVLFRKTKRVVNFQKDQNKARRESGSSVLAQDKHSASYNKDKKKFKEDVNQNFHAEGHGMLETGQSSESSNADEESEERFDSRNLGDFVGVNGATHDKRPMFNPAAAAAASASSAGVSSAASAGSR